MCMSIQYHNNFYLFPSIFAPTLLLYLELKRVSKRTDSH